MTGPGAELPPSLAAHSAFVKRARCARCGAPKTLPSRTAYLYCDHCGALVDYDFRLANQGTNAALTNTVFERLVTPFRPQLAQARDAADYDTYRRIMLYVFQEWIRECPQAVSPRAKTDMVFRDRMIRYCAECAVFRDLDPQLRQLDEGTQAAIAALERIPVEGGAWIVWGEPFWQVASSWKQQMDLAYDAMARLGITAMDPDDPPPGVALKMEYSTFCQAWLPHLTPADGDRLLALYGLTGDYVRARPVPTEHHRCGGCGSGIDTIPDARVVVCEDCGVRVDVAAGAVACGHCGAPLSFPVGASRVPCPYCRTETARV